MVDGLSRAPRGEMSAVGPRPGRPFLAESQQGCQAGRLHANAGIRGLRQVTGRRELPWHDDLEYDFCSTTNQSWLLDLTLLLKTIPVVLLGGGA
jgi:lipopolysaccharide/colanic/teichoic acid biosynthesis glycosyltransferase